MGPVSSGVVQHSTNTKATEAGTDVLQQGAAAATPSAGQHAEAVQAAETQAVPLPAAEAMLWASRNLWFGSDAAMTQLAYSVCPSSSWCCREALSLQSLPMCRSADSQLANSALAHLHDIADKYQPAKNAILDLLAWVTPCTMHAGARRARGPRLCRQ